MYFCSKHVFIILTLSLGGSIESLRFYGIFRICNVLQLLFVTFRNIRIKWSSFYQFLSEEFQITIFVHWPYLMNFILMGTSIKIPMVNISQVFIGFYVLADIENEYFFSFETVYSNEANVQSSNCKNSVQSIWFPHQWWWN